MRKIDLPGFPARLIQSLPNHQHELHNGALYILAANGGFERKALWVNDTAGKTIAEALEQQAYDKNGEPDKATGYDHINDAGTYLPAFEMPIKKPVLVSGLRTAV